MLEEADFVIETDWAALSNAVKHILLGAASASAGGVLELSVSGADPDFCTIRITDPSGAADRRPVETLFDIFHDDKDASPTKYGGAGIGRSEERRVGKAWLCTCRYRWRQTN